MAKLKRDVEEAMQSLDEDVTLRPGERVSEYNLPQRIAFSMRFKIYYVNSLL